MRTTVYGSPTELAVNTITISPNKADPDNTLLFRCFRCGSAVSKVKGKITEVFPGYIESIDAPVITKCIKCPELYTFQSKESNRTYTRVTLAKTSGGKSEFRCIFNRSTLVTIQGEEVRTPFGSRITFPHSLVSAGHTYVFADLV